MPERIARFGPGGSLFGIVTEPERERLRPGAPGVLLLNVGRLNRAGPFRLNVDLARALAAEGFACLRFDQSGLGDSPPRRDLATEESPAVADIRCAMDHLKAIRGLQRFVLVGLCSGADNAHAASLADERVCGAVFIDGYGYRTARYYAHLAARFLGDPARILSFVCLRIRWLIARFRPQAPELGAEAVPVGWTMPAKARIESDLRVLVNRGVHLLYVYSGDSHARQYYNYPHQFRDMYRGIDFRGLADYELFRDGDHIFSQVAARKRLIARIVGWAANRWG